MDKMGPVQGGHRGGEPQPAGKRKKRQGLFKRTRVTSNETVTQTTRPGNKKAGKSNAARTAAAVEPTVTLQYSNKTMQKALANLVNKNDGRAVGQFLKQHSPNTKALNDLLSLLPAKHQKNPTLAKEVRNLYVKHLARNNAPILPPKHSWGKTLSGAAAKLIPTTGQVNVQQEKAWVGVMDKELKTMPHLKQHLLGTGGAGIGAQVHHIGTQQLQARARLEAVKQMQREVVSLAKGEISAEVYNTLRKLEGSEALLKSQVASLQGKLRDLGESSDAWKLSGPVRDVPEHELVFKKLEQEKKLSKADQDLQYVSEYFQSLQEYGMSKYDLKFLADRCVPLLDSSMTVEECMGVCQNAAHLMKETGIEPDAAWSNSYSDFYSNLSSDRKE